MSGLIGLVTGYQGSVQLRRFGADAYTANLVGLANVRELAPLMTAIIVTGRSGAGFAAELGTMRVSEEVDALRTLGFAPHGFLVVPRCLALLIAVPILTLIADVASIAGALAIAMALIDTTATAFLVQTRKAVTLADVGSGVVKSLFYAGAIGVTACHLGLRASGGARGVGERTTSTVVVVLVQLVVIDALLTVVMHEVGLW
jgi:phospholipid/cholesterol/gamma-HCH transport system permease protein